MNTINLLFQILTYLSTIIFAGGAILLFVQSLRRNADWRVRRTLSSILLIWALAYLPFYFHSDTFSQVALSTMSPYMILMGNLYVIVSLLYPLELTRPGWISTQNVTKLLFPYLGIATLYFAVLTIRQEPILILGSVNAFIENIDQFNVWYRLILYTTFCFYLADMFIVSNIHALRYRRQCTGITEPIPPHFVIWLRVYNIGICAITFAYLGMLLTGTATSCLLHRAITLVFFCVILYMSQFSRSLKATVEAYSRR